MEETTLEKKDVESGNKLLKHIERQKAKAAARRNKVAKLRKERKRRRRRIKRNNGR